MPKTKTEQNRHDKSREKARKIFRADLCSVCLVPSRFGVIHLHHADGNPLNNAASNVVPLCAPCHQDVHLEPARRIGVCPACGEPFFSPKGIPSKGATCSAQCAKDMVRSAARQVALSRRGEAASRSEALARLKAGERLKKDNWTGHGRPRKYLWERMEIGGSFFVAAADRSAKDIERGMSSTIRYAKKMTGWNFSVRVVKEGGENGVRVWRVPVGEGKREFIRGLAEERKRMAKIEQEIQLGVPIPKPDCSNAGRKMKYPWSDMAVGSSFRVVPDDGEDIRVVFNGLRSAVRGRSIASGHRYTLRTVVEDGVAGIRVWRVPGYEPSAPTASDVRSDIPPPAPEGVRTFRDSKYTQDEATEMYARMGPEGAWDGSGKVVREWQDVIMSLPMEMGSKAWTDAQDLRRDREVAASKTTDRPDVVVPTKKPKPPVFRASKPDPRAYDGEDGPAF